LYEKEVLRPPTESAAGVLHAVCQRTVPAIYPAQVRRRKETQGASLVNVSTSTIA